jgi:CspA family cold shock protein
MASPETLLFPGPAPSPEQPPEPDAATTPDEADGAQAETGTIKWFSVAKKYGFITPDGGGKDVFVHMSVLKKSAITSLDDGVRVSYDFSEDEGRLSAVNLRVLGPESDG